MKLDLNKVTIALLAVVFLVIIIILVTTTIPLSVGYRSRLEKDTGRVTAIVQDDGTLREYGIEETDE